MTWSKKGNAIHIKNQRGIKDKIVPTLLGFEGTEKLFRKRVSGLLKMTKIQFKQLGFKSIRRKQGDEYFYNNDISNRSLAKLFKKYAAPAKPKLANSLAERVRTLVNGGSVTLELMVNKAEMTRAKTQVVPVKRNTPVIADENLESTTEELEELNSCIEMLQQLDFKMDYFANRDIALKSKIEDILSVTKTVNQVAMESKQEYEHLNKVDLKRKILEIQEATKLMPKLAKIDEPCNIYPD